ncbi:hypothetical protein [Kitasatospora purpeofusca]|uniref:hypothetical protein n=1 Tax=Kitasatospora purpeofusca TaxID=67352 RepID=UPI0036620603
MTVRSAWHPNPGQTRADTRLSPIGTMTPTGSTTTRAGVVPGGTPLALSMSGMTGTIAIGRAAVQGTSAQGAYPVVVTAAETFTVANGHASLIRYDTVWLIAYDTLYDASGQTLVAVVYQQGTAGAGSPPSAPASGTAYLRLWDIQVPSGASAGAPPNWVGGGLLTDKRVYTVALGGINPGGSSVAGQYAGQYRDNAGLLERYTGSAWTPINPVLGSAFVEDTTQRTTTSTSYIDVSTLAASITVPASGRAEVILAARQFATGGITSTSMRASGSSSGTIYTENDVNAMSSAGTETPQQAIARQITATPGETLTVTFKHRVTAGTGTWYYRSISLKGLAA